MTTGIGYSIDERIRRSLAPLGGPLRIDAFLNLVASERARRAALEALKERRAEEPPPPRAQAASPAKAREPEPAAGRRAAPSPQGPAGQSDSAKLRAEVSAFISRDEAEGVNAGEVQEFMDFLGKNALMPDDPVAE